MNGRTVRPQVDAQQAGYSWKLVRKIGAFAKPHSFWLIVAFALLPLLSILMTQKPLIMQYALDQGVARKDVHVIDRSALLYLGIIVLESFGRFAQLYSMQIAGARATHDLRLAVHAFLLRTRLAYFDSQLVGRLVTRVTSDIDALAELFASGALNAIGDLITLVLILVFMFRLHVGLSLVSLITLAPLAIFVNAIRRFARKAYRDIRTRTSKLNAMLGELVSGIAVTTSFGRQRVAEREFDIENEGFRKSNQAAIMFESTLDAVVEGVTILTSAVIVYFVARWVTPDGKAAVTYGTLVAFFQFLEQFFMPLRELTTKFTTIQTALSGGERVFELLDSEGLQDAPELPVSEPSNNKASVLEFRHVSFAYSESVPVLKDVDFVIRQGERVAVVGATGAGKTTLAGLFLRLYERTDGDVLVRGQDVRSYPVKDLRKMFAVVPQDVFLFAGTIAQNIARGDEVDAARVRAVLESIGAWEHFERRGGIDGQVGERANKLSAGERQIVALARALYNDPPIVLLDEATANIDSETEGIIQRALDILVKGRTSLIIAHRLSTIRSADRIIVMHKGHIAETGTHAQLLQAGGLFSRLAKLYGQKKVA